MIIKAGVRVLGIRPEVVLALLVLDGIFKKHGLELRLTSAIEGVHSRASLHYTGNAGDLGLPPANLAARLVAEAKVALGDDFDVILESDHVHVEFQPKAPY